MFHKIVLILIFSLMMLNVFAIDIEQFPENETETTAGDIAKMKGELIVTIETNSGNVKAEVKTEIKESEERIKKLIEEKTNPFLLNMPTIILIIIFGLIWVILKAREKV